MRAERLLMGDYEMEKDYFRVVAIINAADRYLWSRFRKDPHLMPDSARIGIPKALVDATLVRFGETRMGDIDVVAAPCACILGITKNPIRLSP